MAQYVMSDIHGEYEKFKKMLDLIQFSKQDKLYILGDVVDRGNSPIPTLQHIIRTPNMFMILGNHEELFLDAILHNDFNLWFANGGFITYAQYIALNPQDKKEILEYINRLPLCITLDNFVLVHSGIIPAKEPSRWENAQFKQLRDAFLWSREEFYMKPTQMDKTIIFGHTPTCNITNQTPMKIWHDPTYHDKIGIDCGATFKIHGGRLACLNLDTMAEYYVE